MIEMRKHIRQSLSTRLCLNILFVVVLVFSLSLGFLYWQSRNIIREEAIDEASHVLDNTALRVKGFMVEIETATRNIIWLVNLHQHDKDSLLKYTHRIVANQRLLYHDGARDLSCRRIRLLGLFCPFRHQIA